jgi:hypothetical protein
MSRNRTWPARRRALGAGTVLAAGLLAACAGLERNPTVVGTYSDKLSPFNYKEEGNLVLMVVGVDAARFIRNESYFPLFVEVANKSKQTFLVSREAFTLEDSLGRQYPTAPATDLPARYPRGDLDRRLFQQNSSITGTYVNLYTLVPSDFFPSSSRRALLMDQITLPPRSYMEDILYFPIPETGLNGVPLRLLFKVKALEEPVQVVFEVPKTLGIFEKDPDRPKDGH